MFDTIQLVSFVIALLTGLVPLLQRMLRKRFGTEREESYGEKLTRITTNLQKSSQQVDNLLNELATVAQTRARAAASLESEVLRLTNHEKELKKRVQELSSVPIPVADHFAALVAKGERRSALRDYMLFGLGVVVSTIIAIILRIAGLA